MESTITSEIIKPYINPIFFETGTWYGEGLIAAKNAGFKKLYSIELDENLAKLSQEKIPEAKIFCGNSNEIFNECIQKYINEPTTFFLDSHKQLPDQTILTTILNELISIKNHPLKESFIILIDDIRLFKQALFGVTFNELFMNVQNIKNNINIKYIDSRLFKNDIMVIT